MYVISIFVILLSALAYSEAQVRINGGKPARAGQFPYQVALVFTDNRKSEKGDLCGGTLISNQFVLTAAHCVLAEQKPYRLYGYAKVFLGGVKRYIFAEKDRKEYLVTNENFMMHEDYDAVTRENDIALIKLPEAVHTNKFIQVAHLPNHGQTDNDLQKQPIITSGWGKINSKGDRANILYYITSNVHNSKCKSYPFYEKDKQICVHSPGRTACTGDSGGPNVIQQIGVDVVIGVTSIGSGKCEPNHPVFLTRVSYYLDWISKKQKCCLLEKCVC